MKYIELLVTIIAAVAAVASASAAIQLNSVEKNSRAHDEIVTTIKAISDWSRNQTKTAHHCANYMSGYTKADFKKKDNTYEFRILEDIDSRKKLLDCFSAYNDSSGHPIDIDVNNDNIIDPAARIFMGGQILGQLNNYQSIAIMWNVFGEESRAIFCHQLAIRKDSAYVSYREVAKGSDWWQYEGKELPLFMEGCPGDKPTAPVEKAANTPPATRG